MATSSSMQIEGLPQRPVLRPGVFWCRRGDDQLQIGLTAGRSIVIPDSAAARDVLRGLRTGQPPASTPDPIAHRLWRELLASDLVVSHADLDDCRDTAASSGERDARLAVFAHEGAQAPLLLSARAAHRVRVTHDQLPRAADRVRQLLHEAGVGEVGSADNPDLADLDLHLARGEVDRERSDAWVQADRPHLLLASPEGRLRVGPFVVPGQTPCLRCVDACQGAVDPRRSLVVQQYAVASGQEPEERTPIASDLLELALAWAVRDTLSWCEGRTPRTWAATIEVTPSLDLARTTWPIHTSCGCGWGLLDPGQRSA